MLVAFGLDMLVCVNASSSASDVSEGENNNDDAQQHEQDGDQNDSNNGNPPLDRIELQSCSNSTVEICSLGTTMS